MKLLRKASSFVNTRGTVQLIQSVLAAFWLSDEQTAPPILRILPISNLNTSVNRQNEGK